MKLAIKGINTKCNNAEDYKSHPGFIVELQKKVEIQMDYIVSPNSIHSYMKLSFMSYDQCSYCWNRLWVWITWANRKMLRKMLMDGTIGTPGQEKPGGSV